MSVNDGLLRADESRREPEGPCRDRRRGLTVFRKSALAIGLWVSLGHLAFAQTAAITGTVTDQSGGVVDGVQVTATQTATNEKRSATTDKSGNYVITLLPIGGYDVTAAISGFKTEQRTVELHVSDRSTVNFSLTIGQASEKVVVTSGAPLVQTESSSTGEVVDNNRIEQVPLNGRQFQNLAELVPGVNDPAFGSSLGFRGGINIDGTREEENGFLLDGVDIVENVVKSVALRPSVDFVDEFKVDTGSYSAEFGIFGGGQVRATTKSGTNSLHGTAFEFLRNSAFDARNFFDPAGPIPGFRRNDFGGTIGGPIKKNRTFIFGGYEGFISRQAETRDASVPTVANLQGNFTGSAAVRNPTTGQPFPGNIVPASAMSPVSLQIIQQYPAPNLAGGTVGKNYVSTPEDVNNVHQFTTKVDHLISDKDHLSGRYIFYNDYELDPFDVFSGISNLPFYGRDDYQRSQNAEISETHIFTSSLVGELTLGYLRYHQLRENVSHQNWPQTWGIEGTTTNLPPDAGGVPAVLVTGYDSLGKTNLPTDRVDSNYSITPSLTYNHGRHTVKFGAFGANYSTMRLNNGNGLGTYTFTGQYSGNSVADLLLGDVSKASRALGDSRNPLFNSVYALYVQDDWKVSKNLTLNLGLRYDLQSPLRSADDRLVNVNLVTGAIELEGNPGTRRDIGSLINPASAAYNPAVASAAKGISVVNLGTSNISSFSKDDFTPRLGLAYRLLGNDKLVLRTGFGIFINDLLGQYGQSGWNSFPYFVSQTFNGNATVPNLNIANPFAGSGASTISPQAIMANWKSSYIKTYNFGFQASPFRNVLLDIGYSGSDSTHLPATLNVNQPAPSPTGSVASRRPYPQYGNISYTDDSATANYNALQVLAEKRYSSGLEIVLSYTWSKSLDTVGDGTGDSSAPPYVYYWRQTMYGPSSFNVPQRVTLSYVYQLPFGAGRKYLTGTKGWTNRVVGGWELSGVGTFESGRPFTELIAGDQNNTGGSSIDRPNVVGNPFAVPGGKGPNEWFNTAAFALPAFGTDGNVGRNTLVGPRQDSLDVSLVKNNPIGEGKNLQLRAEVFNSLNHVNFDLPYNTVDSAQDGKIYSAEASRQIQLGLKVVF
jgi:outer membrane receptor protein involved in Fe transport